MLPNCADRFDRLITQMIQFIGTTDDPSAVGYYSGFLQGTFSLAQFCTGSFLLPTVTLLCSLPDLFGIVFFWGNLSDHIGRRPVLLIGLLGGATATFCFGFSES